MHYYFLLRLCFPISVYCWYETSRVFFVAWARILLCEVSESPEREDHEEYGFMGSFRSPSVIEGRMCSSMVALISSGTSIILISITFFVMPFLKGYAVCWHRCKIYLSVIYSQHDLLSANFDQKPGENQNGVAMRNLLPLSITNVRVNLSANWYLQNHFCYLYTSQWVYIQILL